MIKKNYLFFILLMMFLLIIVGCSNTANEEPPEAIVKINNNEVETIKGTFAWGVDGLFSDGKVIADGLAPYQMPAEFNMKTEIVRPNAVAIIDFDDGSKPELSGFLWEGESRGSELSSKQNKITLPSEKGEHIIEIQAEWVKGEASYTFVVEVH